MELAAQMFLKIIKARIASCKSSIEHANEQIEKARTDFSEGYWNAIAAIQRIIVEDLEKSLELNKDFVERTENE